MYTNEISNYQPFIGEERRFDDSDNDYLETIIEWDFWLESS